MGTRYSVSQLSGSSGTYGLSIRKSDVLLTGSLLLSGSSSRIQLGTDYSQGRQKNGVFIPNEIFIGSGHDGSVMRPNAAMTFKSQKLVLSGAAGSSGGSSFAVNTLGSGNNYIINTTGDWRLKSLNWGSNTGHYLQIDASTAGKYVFQAKDDGGAGSGITQTFYAGTPGSSGFPSQIKFASGSSQAFFLIDASGSTTDGGSSDRGIYVRNANFGLRYGAGSSQGQDAAGTFFNISGSMVGDSGQKVAETVVSVTPPLNDSSGTKAARLIFAAVSGSIVGAGRGDGRGTEYENRLFIVDGGGLDGAGPKLHVSGTIPLEFGNTDAYIKSDGSSGVTISSAAALSAKGATGASFGDDTGTWEFDGAGAVSETGMTTFSLTPSSTVTIQGGGVSKYGDGTATWDFDGAGAVSETGMTSLSVTPSGAITLTAGAASTWSSSTGALTLTSAAAATWSTAAGALTLNGTGGLTLQEGGGDILTISDSKAVALANATTVNIDASSNILIESSGGAISVGADSVTGAINVGTAGARTITVGSSAATTIVDGTSLTLGSNASTVTLGGSSTTTTIAGNLIVQGTGSFEHSSDISITDKVFLMASGSTTKNTSGGIAIASGSNSTAQAMVFGAYGSTFVDTFIAGRLDIQEDVSHVNTLASATPVSIYAQAMRLKHATGGGSLILSSSATSDSGHRTLELDTADGDRTLTLNEDFTIGDGNNVTITAEDNHSTITLDNANFEVEQTASATQRTVKLATGTDADATLTIEGTAGKINQDLTSDAQATFAGIKSTSNLIVSSSNGLILGDSDNSAAVKIVAPATVSTGYTLTLPAVGTTNDGYVLKAASGASNSAVTLEWAADSAGGVTVGSDVTSGTATRVFYQDSSNDIAQSANFTFDETSVLRVGSTTEGELQLGNDTNNAIGSMKSKLLTSQNLDGATITFDSFAAADFTGGTYLVTISQTSGGTGTSSPYKTLVTQLTIACNSDASTSVIAETRATTDDTVFDEISFGLADGGSTLSVQVTGTSSANTLDSCSISFTRTLIGL